MAALTDVLGDANSQHQTLSDGPVDTARLRRAACLRHLLFPTT